MNIKFGPYLLESAANYGSQWCTWTIRDTRDGRATTVPPGPDAGRMFEAVMGLWHNDEHPTVQEATEVIERDYLLPPSPHRCHYNAPLSNALFEHVRNGGKCGHPGCDK